MITPKGEINEKVLELTKDEEVLKKLSEAKSPEEAYAIAKEKIDIDFEDFKSSMAVASACIQDTANSELSDEDLEAVAGGKASGTTVEWIKAGISIVGATAGVAGAAASAAGV